MAAPAAGTAAGSGASVLAVTATPEGRARARSIRARRRAAKAGSGSTGLTGVRSTSNGSVTAAPFREFGVGAPEGGPGAHQQRLGGVQGPVQQSGDLGDRQVVEVAQGEGDAVVRGQPVEGRPAGPAP